MGPLPGTFFEAIVAQAHAVPRRATRNNDEAPLKWNQAGKAGTDGAPGATGPARMHQSDSSYRGHPGFH